MNVHQISLSDAFYKILGEDYKFIEFGERRSQAGEYSLSAKGVNLERPYIIRMFESIESEQIAIKLLNDADVVITAGEPLALLKKRLYSNKIVFRQGERSFKGPFWKDIIRFPKVFYHYKKNNWPNYRKLCLSAYAPNDLRMLGPKYMEKCYKFAYFVGIPDLDIEEIIRHRSKGKLEIVWCSRFIGWKHPEMVVQLAEKMLSSGRDNFEIKMIGANTTSLWNEIKEKVNFKGLCHHVILTGGMPNSEVQQCMRESDIFIFTSDRGEGWGAVLNEAMGAGCACIASHEIGAVPFLLKDKENGLIFRSCSVDSLYEKVAYLYDNPEDCSKYGKQAYQTITTEWSSMNAAQRLLQLSEGILTNHEIAFEDGPCSKAYPINKKKLLL